MDKLSPRTFRPYIYESADYGMTRIILQKTMQMSTHVLQRLLHVPPTSKQPPAIVDLSQRPELAVNLADRGAGSMSRAAAPRASAWGQA